MNDLNTPPLSARLKGRLKPFADQEVACNHCGMYGMCEEAGLSRDPQMLDRVVRRRAFVARGAELFQAGEPFKYLYAVKSGSFAAVGEDGEGKRKIYGFYFPGDMLGLDAIENGSYHNSVVALEKSSVCKLDYENVVMLGERQSGFYRQLINAMSNRMLVERWTALLLGIQSTEQRLAAFLYYLSTHLEVRGLPHREFRLSMTRQDIADHLGMAMETASRAFSGLQKKGVMALKGRNTCINEPDELMAAAGIERPAATI